MNYTLESSFLEDEAFGTMLWAEKLLAGFVTGPDDRLGLNKCSPSEKKLIKLLCRAFLVEYLETPQRCYVQKTRDSRTPFITIKDMLTQKKIAKHFSAFDAKFHDNRADFPCEFLAFESNPVDKEGLSKASAKPTNKEVSQHEMSLHSVHSRGSSISSESRSKRGSEIWKRIKPADSDDGSVRDNRDSRDNDSDSRQERDSPHHSKKSSINGKIDNKENLGAGERDPHQSIGVELNNPGANINHIKQFASADFAEKLKPQPSTQQAPPLARSRPRDGTPGEDQPLLHAVPDRAKLERVKWVRKPVDDVTRLPSIYHILFAVLEQTDAPAFSTAASKLPGLAALKLVAKLGAFLVMDSEFSAQQAFEQLSEAFLLFPLKEVPKSVQNDALRTEICFMEGIRPQKTTAVAERFIYRHLGFK